MKTVFLFSGQGSQYPGMGAELAEKSSAAKQILECGSDIMGFDLMKKLTESAPEELAQTRLSQPAIFTVSMLALAAAIGISYFGRIININFIHIFLL